MEIKPPLDEDDFVNHEERFFWGAIDDLEGEGLSDEQIAAVIGRALKVTIDPAAIEELRQRHSF